MLPQNPILVKPYQFNKAANNVVQTDFKRALKSTCISETLPPEKLFSKDCRFINPGYYYDAYPRAFPGVKQKITGTFIVLSSIAISRRAFQANWWLVLSNCQNRSSNE